MNNRILIKALRAALEVLEQEDEEDKKPQHRQRRIPTGPVDELAIKRAKAAAARNGIKVANVDSTQ